MSTDKATPPWRLATLLHAPHRLSFFMAAVVMATSALWWWLEITARTGLGPALPSVVAPALLHPVVMALGFMPLFFCGFLFTAGPKWLQMPEVTARAIAPAVLTLGFGWAMVLGGSFVHPLASALGALLAAVGWALATLRFAGLVRRSRARDRLHASVIATACGLGVLAMLGAAAGLATLDLRVIRLSALLGLWWFVVPVYVTVAHRMIPFFTASALPVLDAWRPNWLLWTLLAMVGLQGLWVATDASGVAAWHGPVWQGLHAFTACLSGALVAGLAVRWGLVQSLRIRLLAMLHIGFVWLGIALGLDALAVVFDAAGSVSLRLLPVHALTMGFLGSILLAMATRVSCGHGGRTLTADNPAWALFWTLQLATVLRLAAIVWPAAAVWLLWLGATAWLLAVGGWAVRHGRWYGRPRLDGRPG